MLRKSHSFRGAAVILVLVRGLGARARGRGGDGTHHRGAEEQLLRIADCEFRIADLRLFPVSKLFSKFNWQFAIRNSSFDPHVP